MLENENNPVSETEDVHTILEQETETKPASEQKTRLWSYGEDVEIISETTKTGSQTTTAQPSQQAKLTTNKPVNKEDAKMSAETVVTSIGIVLEMGGSIVVSNKCKKKFTSDEFKRAKEIRDTNPETLIPNDVMLQNKFKRELAIKDNKIKELKIEDDQYNKLTSVFAKYFETTGKSVPPEFMLLMGITNLLIEKATVIFMD